MILPVSSALLAARTLVDPSPDVTSIQIPTHKPPYAEKLSPQLAAFSIEMDRWADWAGPAVGTPNNYTNQLMTNLGERTGVMPYLRVGANSEDRSIVDLSIEIIEQTFPEPTPEFPQPEANGNAIGRDFYALSANFPAGTTFQWGLNLLHLNKTETTAQAALLADTFQGSRAAELAHVHLDAVEIGNEPDVYGNAYAPRPGPLGDPWTPRNYTNTWKDFARSVATEVDFDGEGSPGLAPVAFVGFTTTWDQVSVFQAGLLDDEDLTPKISQFTDHSYFGLFVPGASPPTGTLMDKWNTRNNVTHRTRQADVVRQYGLKYVYGEMSSYANHGIPGISNTLESAVWIVDMMLLMATHGVERCHFHHGVGFSYNTFQPVPIANPQDGTDITQPHVLPSYNGMLAVNEAIGTSGDAWVTEISTLSNTISAYGIYEGDRLARIVLLNQEVHSGDGEKPNVRITFDDLEGWTGSLKRLTGPQTTSTSGITWAGQSFETADGTPDGEVADEKATEGFVEIESSTVVLITLD